MNKVVFPSLSHRLLARNVLWNLTGFLLPLGVALVVIPALISHLGTERFGMLTLAWVALGYFGLFDLGLGRALTQIISVRLGSGRFEEVPDIAWTAWLLMAVLGAAGGVALAISVEWLTADALQVPRALQSEASASLLMVALGVPFVITTTGLRGLLEACQRFDLVNVVRLFNGVFTFLGPLIALQWKSDLTGAVGALLITRVIAWFVYAALCLWSMPTLRQGMRFRPHVIPEMLRFGGWLTITNLIGPLMDYMDRFLVAALVTLAAVAYYATPFELVTKLLFVSASIVGVLYPAFAASRSRDDEDAEKYYIYGIKFVYILVFPMVLMAIAFSQEVIELWLGQEFAAQSVSVLRWLAAGVLVNSLAQVPYAFLQGSGRPDLTAKLHLIELPIYLVCAWWVIGQFGIVGAAVVWTARVGLDALILFLMAQRRLSSKLAVCSGGIAWVVSAAVCLLVVAMPHSFMLRVTLALGIMFLFAVAVWVYLFDANERRILRKPIQAWRSAT
ncbi:MAG: flippase [Nitrospira sp.]|nr:flippase [Nitrospira sp.]